MSICWFSKPLGDGIWAYSLTDQVRDAFEPLFVLAGRPLDMAVFTRHESDGRLQCEVIAYFPRRPPLWRMCSMPCRAKNRRVTTWICWRAIRAAGLCFSRMMDKKWLHHTAHLFE